MRKAGGTRIVRGEVDLNNLPPLTRAQKGGSRH